MPDEPMVELRKAMLRDADIRLMVRLVLTSEDVTSLEELKELSPETFAILCDEAESLESQGTP